MSENIDTQKIEHLLDHWIEHNNSHLHSFEEWSDKIKNSGYATVASQILDAASKMEECNKKLSEIRAKLHDQ